MTRYFWNSRDQVRASLVLIASLGAGTLLSAESSCRAAQNKATKAAPTAPKPSSGAPKPTVAPAAQPRTDNAAREAVLESAEWQEMVRDFSDWLAVQVFYDEQTVAQMRLRLNSGVERMSAEQLKTFLALMQDRLDVLYGPMAQDVEVYLAEKFAVASPAYIQRVRQRLPDVLSLSASQINQQLLVFASKRENKQQKQQAFNESRQQRIAVNQAKIQSRKEAQNQAVARRGRSAAIIAASTENDFAPAREYFPEARNQGGFGMPFMGGLMGGGIMW